jgi:hypothetical protein
MIKPLSTETPLKIRNSHRWYPSFKVTQLSHSMLLKNVIDSALELKLEICAVMFTLSLL